MAFTPPARDFSKVRHAGLVQQFDPDFAALSDSLKDAYHNFWKSELSKDFLGFDVIAQDQRATHDQYQTIYGAIWHFRTLVFHEKNTESVDPISRDLYDFQRDENGVLRDSDDLPDGSMVELSRRWLRRFEADHLAIFTALAGWAGSKGFTADHRAVD